MMKKQSGQMMVMLLPEHVMGALKGSDEQSGEGEPTEEASGEGEPMDGEEEGPGMGMKMHGKQCPVCGR